MISLQGVTKIYKAGRRPNVVLDHIDATFAPRDSIGILGKNRAGKSTLLRILGGAELPDSGHVVRQGRISWPIGFAGGFHPSLSGEENCKFVARVYHADVSRVVEFAREFADIGRHFRSPIRTYSSGMRARLAFGLSMAIDFDVYLVDEVTAVGDTKFQERCHAAFRERRTHSSIIMVSHNLDTLRDYCNRCAVLHAGKLHFFDSVDDASAMYEAVS